MAFVTYRNNRLVPAVIIAACILLFFALLDPAVDHSKLSTPLNPPNSHAELIGEHYIKVGASNNKASLADASLDQDEEPLKVPDEEEENAPTTSATPGTSTTTTSDSASMSPYAAVNGLAPTDVLLIVKTGGTTMWKRLLVHLTTTLAPERIPRDNVVIYSDIVETVGHFTTVDILANMPRDAKAAPDFDVYRQQPEYMDNNYYVEASGVGGDEWGPTGGWIIDKYKFVPLMQHAGENWPKAKWYIYMEDDTYLFLPSVLAHLSQFDHTESHYLGSYAAKSDVVFAHGGAGFAVSRGAWEKSFGQNKGMVDEYYKYTTEHCCGDQVLAHAMAKYGVKFGENGGDEKFTWGFNPVVHWTFAFSRHNWCSPLMSFHKVHSRDVAQYYDFERSLDPSKPFLHKDFFNKMMLGRIQKRLEWWDNMAALYEVSSANREWAPAPTDDKYDAAAWKDAWQSADACEAACEGWENCVQWSFVEDLCRVDDKLILGQGFAPAMSQRKTSLMHTSGWLPQRLDSWTC